MDDRSVLTLYEYRQGGQAQQHHDRGLLTLMYCPGDNGLLDKHGRSVVPAQNELIVVAGAALETASAGAYPAARHAVRAVAGPEPRTSLVYSARGCGSASLDPARFCEQAAGSGRAKKTGSGSSTTLDGFYKTWEATHTSVNAPAPSSSSSSASSESSSSSRGNVLLAGSDCILSLYSLPPSSFSQCPRALSSAPGFRSRSRSRAAPSNV